MAVQTKVQEFLKIVQEDQTLEKKVAARAAGDKAELAAWVVSLAAERGLVLSLEEVEASLLEPVELSDEELANVAGGRVFRITNVRVNANGIGGGSASGSLPVL